MSENAAIDKAEATVQPGGRFAFLLRPWFLIVVTFLVILVAIPLGYRTSRLAAIPPIEEIIDRKAEKRIEIEPGQNAFTFYDRAWKLIPAELDEEAIGDGLSELETEGWDGVSPAARNAVDQCEAALDEWKRGTELERGLQALPADVTWNDSDDQVFGIVTIAQLALLRSARCRHEFQLEESWQWLRAVLRFSRHLGTSGSFMGHYQGMSLHSMASQRVVEWAAHDKVTFGQLGEALQKLREIHRLTEPTSTFLKTYYIVIANSLSKPELLRELYIDLPTVEDLPTQLHGTWLFLNAEPQVTLPLLRHLYANYLSQCDLPRWERTVAGTASGLFLPTGTETPPLIEPAMLEGLLLRSPIAEQLAGDMGTIESCDNEQVLQTALELCLSVELFRRRHGAYPDSLDALVPEFVAEIPRDVYGSTSTDRFLMARREAAPAALPPASLDEELPDTAPGLIIYGRGANGTDDGGQIFYGEDIGLRIPFPSTEVKTE